MHELKWSMRRLILIHLAAVALALTCAPGSALAQDEVVVNTRVDTQRFRLSGSFDSWVFLEGTHLGEAWQLDGSVWMHAARRPVVFTLDGAPADPAIAGRVGAVVHAGFNIGPRVRLSLDMPLALYQQGADPLTGEELTVGGVGDLRLNPVVQILDAQKYWLGLALSAPISFPTGSKDAYLGENGPTIQPRLSAEKRFSFTPRRWLNFAVGVDLGWRFRPRTQLLDLDSGGEFTFGFGFRWEPGEVVAVGTEVVAAVGSGANARHGEWLTWARLSPGKKKNYRVIGGFAVGLGRGVGTPEGRGFVAIQGTLGLKQRIEGGDAGVEDEGPSPSVVVEVSPQIDPQPSRLGTDDGWGLLLLQRPFRIETLVLFEPGSAVISENSQSELGELAAWLRTHAEAGQIEVRGHTGDEGDAQKLQDLSQARADSALGYLVQQGVDAKRLSILTFGKDILPRTEKEASPEEVAAASRRVDFRFVVTAKK